MNAIVLLMHFSSTEIRGNLGKLKKISSFYSNYCCLIIFVPVPSYSFIYSYFLFDFDLLTGFPSRRPLPVNLSVPCVANSLTSWMHFNFLEMSLANK